MERIKEFLNQKKILVLLLVSLAISIGLNGYLFFGVIQPSQVGRDGQETYAWINGSGSHMWGMFSIKLTPNRAVFSYSGDQQFNVSIKGLYWAPFDYGPRTFYFKIYDKIIYRGIIPVDESPKLVGEISAIANKSKDEMYCAISTSNFTVTFDKIGIHLYTVVGNTVPDVTLTSYDCKATFAVNIK